MRGRLLFLLVFMALIAGSLGGTDFSSRAGKVQVETCQDVLDVVADFSDCHDNFPTGCSHAQNPRYDPYLNFLKNQALGPAQAGSQTITSLQQVDDLESGLPDTLGSGNHAAHAEELAQLGEGNLITVAGYLYYAENTGKKIHANQKGETSNCQLLGTANADFHLGIGFDADVARRIRNHQLRHAAAGAAPGDVEQTSIIAEMTPHTRAQFHPAWTFPRVSKAAGKQVLLVGQLIADNEHAKGSDDCGNPNANTDACWRASIWEVHPVTDFFVCTSAQPCNPGDLTTWTKLEDMP